jgi:hypothetical protein
MQRLRSGRAGARKKTCTDVFVDCSCHSREEHRQWHSEEEKKGSSEEKTWWSWEGKRAKDRQSETKSVEMEKVDEETDRYERQP